MACRNTKDIVIEVVVSLHYLATQIDFFECLCVSVQVKKVIVDRLTFLANESCVKNFRAKRDLVTSEKTYIWHKSSLSENIFPILLRIKKKHSNHFIHQR